MNSPRLELVHHAQADTDYTIAYIDGRPAAISEKHSGGHYAFFKDSEYIYNQNERQCWYVNDGKWHSTLSAACFAQQSSSRSL